MKIVARSPYIRHLEYNMDVLHKSNFLVTTGSKGSGKSWLGLRHGQIINGESLDDFGMHKVCFSSSIFLNRMDKGEYRRRDVVLLEELGVSANSRDAMTQANKNLSFIAQTIRPAEITLIANTITWGLMDSQVKNMADFRLKVIGYDAVSAMTEFKCFTIKPSDSGQESYQEHLQFGTEKYVSWLLKRPTKELTDLYEPARKEYLRQLYSGKSINKNAQFGVEDAIGAKKPTLKEYIELGLGMHEKLVDGDEVSTAMVEIQMNINDRHKASTIAKGINLEWKAKGGK